MHRYINIIIKVRDKKGSSQSNNRPIIRPPVIPETQVTRSRLKKDNCVAANPCNYLC